MKKFLLPLMSLGILTSLSTTAQITVTNMNVEAQHADVTVMDWDKDGDLDVLISGETGNGGGYTVNMTAFLNDGMGMYTATTVPFTGVARGAFDWNDINMDGNPDLIENGFALGIGAYARVFNSNGSGVFTENPLVLPQMAISSGFADFNNDGYIDIYLFGNNNFGPSKIFINDRAGGFTDSHALDAYDFHIDPDVTVVDFDNDKDLDLLVSDKKGEPRPFTTYTRIFKNTNGAFAEMQLDSRGVAVGYGSSTWGDYDGDGFLDVLVNGDGNDNSYFSYKLYKSNAGVSFTLVDSFRYGQFSTGDGGRFLDWDNDGDLDFIATGYNDVINTQATAVFLNNAGVFTPYANNALLPGVSESSIEVGDVDNDSDLDVFITGFSGNDFDGAGPAPLNRHVSLLITNPATAVNLPPSSPTNLNVSGSQAAITFSWNAATDATTPQNALSYNMFLVDDLGKTFVYSLADTATGKLMLPRLGNVQLNKGWIIKGLPVGNYRWGVQAVDNSFAGSMFAKGNFTVNADGTLPVSLLTYNVKAEGKKVKIEWSTVSEQNNDHFDIQRSGDGINFSHLARVNVKGSGPGQYLVYDNYPSNGRNYYRLTQYDIDGKSKDHGIRTINLTSSGKPSVVLYPNPTFAEVGIRLSNFAGKQVTVTMTDFSGKMVHAEKIMVNNGQGYFTLHLKARPAGGQYILNVSGDDLKETLKLMVR